MASSLVPWCGALSGTRLLRRGSGKPFPQRGPRNPLPQPLPPTGRAIAYESTVSFAFTLPPLILHLPETCHALPRLRNEGQARPRVGAVRASLRTTLRRSHFRVGCSERASTTRPPLGWVGLGPVLVAPCGCGAGRDGDGGIVSLGRDWGLARTGNRVSRLFRATGGPNCDCPPPTGAGESAPLPGARDR